MIDYKDAAQVRELMEKVTPGPWAAMNHYETDDSEVTAAVVECENQRMVAEVDPSFEGYEDAQFIALSRDALPYWIERAEQAESELDERRELQEAQSKAIVREQERAEAAERAVERLLDAGPRCPTPEMYQNCCEYNDAKCRACRKAWAMKEGK